jgi:hypothetical protein
MANWQVEMSYDKSPLIRDKKEKIRKRDVQADVRKDDQEHQDHSSFPERGKTCPRAIQELMDEAAEVSLSSSQSLDV